jgi:hypothetical protein
MWFDRAKCGDGVEMLRQYQAEYDERTRTFKNTPRHDYTSHCSDALRYLCMAYRELKPKPVEKPRNSLRQPTLAELTAQHDKSRKRATGRIA